MYTHSIELKFYTFSRFSNIKYTLYTRYTFPRAIFITCATFSTMLFTYFSNLLIRPIFFVGIFRNVTGCDSVATTTVGATPMNTGLILTNWMGRDPRSQLCPWSRCVRPCSIPLIKWMPDHYALALKDGLISKRNLVSKRFTALGRSNFSPSHERIVNSDG